MPRVELPPSLLALDPAALKAVAEYHANIAAAIADRLADLERRAAAHAKPLEPFAEGLGKVAAELGIDEASARYRVPVPTVKVYLTLYKRKAKAEAVRLRNIEVMRLADRGWPNARIAKRVGLSAPTVARIIARAILATTRRPNRPAGDPKGTVE